MTRDQGNERGAVIVLCLIIVLGVTVLSMAFLSRTLGESNLAVTQANSRKALFEAYGSLAQAEVILGRAWYDPVSGRNLALVAALNDPNLEVGDTGVMVEPIGDPDTSEFFHLVASATAGRITRTVRALMSERENFASYNYFVNSHPLGISGRVTPRGGIHTNKRMDFYFADGEFVDPVTASEGFLFVAGATAENTSFLGPTNPGVDPVDDLMGIDIPSMQDSADYVVSDASLNTKIFLEGGQIRIQKWTEGGWVQEPLITPVWTQVGEEEVTVTREDPVYVTETYEEIEVIWAWEDYTWIETIPIYETETYTYDETVPVFEDREEERTREVPVYSTRTVIEERTELVWVPDDDPDAVGGTAIAGGDGGDGPGHWENQIVEYETTETYLDHHETETYYVTVSVQIGTETVEQTGTRQVQVGEEEVEQTGTRQVQIGEETVEKTREVIDHYETVTETVMDPIYELIMTQTGLQWVYQEPELVGEDTVGPNGIIYTAGDVTALEGTLDGRLTLASNGDVSITGSVVYIDEEGDTSYTNGDDPDLPYQPNPDYTGSSVVGVMAEGDILYENSVPSNFELNASLVAKTGRVGITGILLDSEGEVELDPNIDSYLKNSFRRLGGIISNLRPVSTFIDADYRPAAGFLRGQSVFDRSLQFKPPVGFPGRRRPRKIATVSREVVQ